MGTPPTSRMRSAVEWLFAEGSDADKPTASRAATRAPSAALTVPRSQVFGSSCHRKR
jgi:hypothetical protein